MSNQTTLTSEKELHKAILQEKLKGTPDIEIGKKYGVNFKFIEKLITKSKGINISNLNVSKKIKTLVPNDFKEEQTTIWSFKSRGSWATHSGEYRGNWSPYLPRNVILKYSKPGEIVLDYFCGAGTTAVEAKLLGRRCIAFDINEEAVELSKKNMDFSIPPQFNLGDNGNITEFYDPDVKVGDARNLLTVKSSSIHLICAHPPYANIIQYTDSKEGDLSQCDIDEFLLEMAKVAKESYRVLKTGRQCAILIGDMRRNKNVVPLGFKTIDVFEKVGFKVKELIIKRQHNCKTTGFWYDNSVKFNFLLLAHEYLVIFEKPKPKFEYVYETTTGYTALTPIMEKMPLKKKLDTLETTTVWVLPEKGFEEQLNKNIVERYSRGNYLTISFTKPKDAKKLGSQKNKDLLFIKHPFENLVRINIKLHLQKIKVIIEKQMPIIIKNGFVIIQTQDIRMNKNVILMAKYIINNIIIDGLSLKEIIIVIKEIQNQEPRKENSNLKISHQYLLVYERKYNGN